MKISQFSERLRRMIAALEIPDYELARVGEVSTGTVSAYINSHRIPKLDTLTHWIITYGINPTWLLLGEGEMFRDGNTVEGKKQGQNKEEHSDGKNEKTEPSNLVAKRQNKISYISTVRSALAFISEYENHLYLTNSDHTATAILLTPKKIVLRCGSVVGKIKPSIPDYASQKREMALLRNMLRPTDDSHFILTDDISFSSVSSAASFVTGSACNGWIYWNEIRSGSNLAKFKNILKNQEII